MPRKAAPRAKAKGPAPAPRRKAAPEKKVKAAATIAKPAIAAKAVLIIDADQSSIRIARSFLEPEGYLIHGVQDPLEGLRLAKEGKIHLVLVDISLAEMDGYQVCKSLATDYRTCNIPVVFLTQRTEPADRLLGFLAGGSDYITKPFTRDSIVQGVHKLLRG